MASDTYAAKYMRQLRAENPEKAREYQRKYREAHPERIKSYHAKWRRANREKRLAWSRDWRFKKYGITETQFVRMLEKQDGKCGNRGCGRVLTRSDSIDHNHGTGAVRGVLCVRCNAALGQVGDSISRLIGLIDYLKKDLDSPSGKA